MPVCAAGASRPTLLSPSGGSTSESFHFVCRGLRLEWKNALCWVSGDRECFDIQDTAIIK